MPKPTPLTAPATPIALQPHHLLSPPPDRLTNTATTLSISHAQLEDNPTCIYTIHRLHPHEPPDSPDRQLLLYTIHTKPWPNTTRIICTPEAIPILHLRRAWLPGTRRWRIRLPEKQTEKEKADLLEASMPWTSPGPGPIGAGSARLNVRFANALPRCTSVSTRERNDEPPPYSAVAASEGNGSIRDEKPHSDVRGEGALPSYDSVRGDGPNALRDLLDAIEPPREPMPASFVGSGSSGVEFGSGGGRSGSEVELRVGQLGGSGTGVMMGNQKIVHITRHNAIDYSKSKPRSRPRWEAEVAEGVDLLLVSFLFLTEWFSNIVRY